MFNVLLKIVELLLGRSDKLREAESDRRKRISLYFENVGRCLSDIATALRREKSPSEACAELRQYAVRASRENEEENPIAAVYGEAMSRDIYRYLDLLVVSPASAMHKVQTLQLITMSPEAASRVASIPELRTRYGNAQKELDEAIRIIEEAAGQFKALSVLAASGL
jgi:hypothetical protein